MARSSLAGRFAGSQQAIAATDASTTAAPTIVTTIYNKLFIE